MKVLPIIITKIKLNVMNDIIFSKETLKEAISTIGRAAYTLIYDSNDKSAQITAGKELLQAKWILATIADHVYDYYPVSYFLSDDDKKEYPDFWKWFMSHSDVAVSNAIKFVQENFALLETITRDKYNRHRVPERDLDKELRALLVLKEVSANIDYFVSKFNSPKKTNDPEKPTATEIRALIKSISQVQNMYTKLAEAKNNHEFTMKVFQHNQLLDMYKNPLFAAWQIYKYGWHTDFLEEGDSMGGYMMFELRAKEMTADLITTLEEDSPFASIERNSAITNGLLRVYRHLLKQDFGKL